MSDVFISYSRKDGEFVQRLSTAFVGANRVVWIDWQDIARGDEWWRTIEGGIEDAENFICIISENWLTSKICHKELLHAREQNKRVLPIIRQRIEGETLIRVEQAWNSADWNATPAGDNWTFLKARNWIFFDSDDISRFLSEFNALLKALDEDQPHIKAHTRFQADALEWQRSERNPSFLLGGDQLTFAEKWLSESAGKQPEPTQVQREFIAASWKEENARQRRIRQLRRATIGLGIVGVIAALVAALMFGQASSANQEREAAIVARGQAEAEQSILGTREAAANEQIGTAARILSTATVVARQVDEGGATLDAVNIQLQDSNAQVAAANRSLATATIVARQVGQAEATLEVINAELSVANDSLAQVPPTLTAVALAVADAQRQQDISMRFADAILQMEDTPSEAQRTIERIIADYPDEALTYLGRGLISWSQGNIDDAIADFTYAIDLNPQFVRAYMNRANAYSNQGQIGDAVADFIRVIEIDPHNAQAYYNLGTIVARQGHLEEAIVHFTRAIELDPQLALAYYNRGLAYSIQEHLEDAITDFSYAIELDPQFIDAYNNRGVAYMMQGALDQAMVDFNRAIKINDQFMNPYAGRGIAYYSLGNFQAALNDWQTFEELGGHLPAELVSIRDALLATLTPMPTPSATPND